MGRLGDLVGRSPGLAWVVRQCRAHVCSLPFAAVTLVGAACVGAGQVLDLLALDEQQSRFWEVGAATAVSMGSLWGIGGAEDPPDSGAVEMLDASRLGATARWLAGTAARWGSGLVLGILLLLFTFVLTICAYP